MLAYITFHDDNDNILVWRTWAVGALVRDARCKVFRNTVPSLRTAGCTQRKVDTSPYYVLTSTTHIHPL